MRQMTHWIDNSHVDWPTDNWGDVYDPSTGLVQAQVALATKEQVDAAVQSS